MHTADAFRPKCFLNRGNHPPVPEPPLLYFCTLSYGKLFKSDLIPVRMARNDLNITMNHGLWVRRRVGKGVVDIEKAKVERKSVEDIINSLDLLYSEVRSRKMKPYPGRLEKPACACRKSKSRMILDTYKNKGKI